MSPNQPRFHGFPATSDISPPPNTGSWAAAPTIVTRSIVGSSTERASHAERTCLVRDRPPSLGISCREFLAFSPEFRAKIFPPSPEKCSSSESDAPNAPRLDSPGSLRSCSSLASSRQRTIVAGTPCWYLIPTQSFSQSVIPAPSSQCAPPLNTRTSSKCPLRTFS